MLNCSFHFYTWDYEVLAALKLFTDEIQFVSMFLISKQSIYNHHRWSLSVLSVDVQPVPAGIYFKRSQASELQESATVAQCMEAAQRVAEPEWRRGK